MLSARFLVFKDAGIVQTQGVFHMSLHIVPTPSTIITINANTTELFSRRESDSLDDELSYCYQFPCRTLVSLNKIQDQHACTSQTREDDSP